MTIYEAVGIAYIILTSLLGQIAVLWVLWHGKERIKGRLDLGQQDEDCAIRDYMVGPPAFPSKAEIRR